MRDFPDIGFLAFAGAAPARIDGTFEIAVRRKSPLRSFAGIDIARTGRSVSSVVIEFQIKTDHTGRVCGSLRTKANSTISLERPLLERHERALSAVISSAS